MKENYKSWEIIYEDFYKQKSLFDKLRFLVQFALLAPSGHNTQPWKFQINENSILIEPDLIRSLPKSDPNDRQLFISLGCAIENLLVAADYYLLDTSVEYLPAENRNVAAKISFSENSSKAPEENHLALAIPKRHTNRFKYLKKMPGEKFLEWVRNFKLDVSDDDVLQVNIIENSELKNAAAEIASMALVKTMDDADFRLELSHYLKSNFTSAKVGMPGFAHGIPGPVSLFASPLIRKINMNRLSLKQDTRLLKEFTPVFVVISTGKDDKKSWLRAGQCYEHIALEAVKNGLQTSPLAAPIQREKYNQDLKQLLGIAGRPQIIFRLGYSIKPSALTPRLSLNEVMNP